MTASRWKYFTEEELGCRGEHCCSNSSYMSNAFMERLVALREEAGFAFIITSAYRCPTYNSQVSKTGFSGPHVTGRAVDILLRGVLVYRLLPLLEKHGFTGIGLAQKGKDRFIHIDDLPEAQRRPRPWVWSY